MWSKVWIWKRKSKNNKITYTLCWYNESGKMRTKSVGRDKKIAQQVARKKELELNSGITNEVKSISYDDFCKEHLKLLRGRVSSATFVEQETTLRQFGDICRPRRVHCITLKMMEEFLAARSSSVKAGTLNKNLRTLKAILNLAVKRGYLRENPAEGIRPMKVPEKEMRVLSVEEIGKLLRACCDLRWRAFAALALTTGMKRGELCHLEWKNSDFENGIITVGNKANWATKSGKIRKLGVSSLVLGLLKELRGIHPYPTVFATDLGTLWGNNMTGSFKGIVKRAGIPHCTMHDLRRTFISHLSMAGVNEAVVQKIAGHASMATTVKHYTNILTDAQIKAHRKLPYLQGEKS